MSNIGKNHDLAQKLLKFYNEDEITKLILMNI